MKIIVLRTKSGFYRMLLYIIGVITFGIFNSSCNSNSGYKYGPPTHNRKLDSIDKVHDSLNKAKLTDSLNLIKQDSLNDAKRKADSLAKLKNTNNSGTRVTPPKYGGPIRHPTKYGPKSVN